MLPNLYFYPVRAGAKSDLTWNFFLCQKVLIGEQLPIPVDVTLSPENLKASFVEAAHVSN